MKILEVKRLPIADLRVIRFGRFRDHRGYFTEPYRRGDLDKHPETAFLRGMPVVQANESWSRAGTIRGLHFQWNPYMGKLVRTISGRMVDLALDIRKGSPTSGKIVAYDMPAALDRDYDEWIWVPPGFAHGNYFSEASQIEYLCTGEYSPGCEGSVSPLASDIDWSLVSADLQKEFRELRQKGPTISDKDRDAVSFTDWIKDPRSDNFQYTALTQSAESK
jgi:dTDP-4-dehydrorhamnose 3,5-epimerase